MRKQIEQEAEARTLRENEAAEARLRAEYEAEHQRLKAEADLKLRNALEKIETDAQRVLAPPPPPAPMDLSFINEAVKSAFLEANQTNDRRFLETPSAPAADRQQF